MKGGTATGTATHQHQQQLQQQQQQQPPPPHLSQPSQASHSSHPSQPPRFKLQCGAATPSKRYTYELAFQDSLLHPTFHTSATATTAPTADHHNEEMKGVKNMGINRVLGSIRRKANTHHGPVDRSPEIVLDTPEANAIRNVRLFCESGASQGTGEEVLYLPSIVEACESSPTAAREACALIRKFLSGNNYATPYVQYNSIMLIRILADNPGRTFTRNIDAKFVQTIKDLARGGKDLSVKQLLMETLDNFGRTKSNDEGLALLNEMWKKECDKMNRIHGPQESRPLYPPASAAQQQPLSHQNYFSRSHSSRKLPAPRELASRIEEARTSATLLSQVVQSTPPSELLASELVREFADRCQSASRSVQAYMIAEHPSPDNETMETLIETNELLNKALSRHQRGLLNARKATGLSSGGEVTSPANESFAPPANPSPGSDDENPFSDPEDEAAHNPPFPQDRHGAATDQFKDRLGIEPYHPGFKETPKEDEHSGDEKRVQIKEPNYRF